MRRLPFLLLAAFLGFTVATPAQAAWFGSDKKNPAPGSSAAPAQQHEDVYDLLKNNKELDKFVDLIGDAGLKDLFHNKDTAITVFAPSNSAISDMSRADNKKINASKESLQSFVKYHVIVGSRVGSSAMNQRKFSSAAANGESISFDGTDKDGVKVNSAHIITSDMSVGNSVVHIISAALIPPSLQEAKPEGKNDETPAIEAPIAPVAPKTPVAKAPVEPEEPVVSKVATPIASTVAAPVPVSSTVAVPVSTSLSKKSSITVGSSKIMVGTSVPAGSSVPVTSAVAVPVATAAPAAAEPSKGFSLFGHTFGGGN